MVLVEGKARRVEAKLLAEAVMAGVVSSIRSLGLIVAPEETKALLFHNPDAA